ncbi:hypothetical protein [Nibricoccus sp. IMCC34717]|uniref:hypothetical protein n=1 Tax=Nibricoccus sp. IMCC34717 TaxID=3034021 RepID=UPI00384ECE3B
MAEKKAGLAPKLVAVDTNVIFHLAEDHAPSLNLILRLIRRGYTPIVTQTVVQELAYAYSFSKEASKRKVAEKALRNLLNWGIQVINLKPVGNGICDVVADKIGSKHLLPPSERHDAFVVIEASFCAAVFLCSWDNHLLHADNAALNQILSEHDLNPVSILPPSKVLDWS